MKRRVPLFIAAIGGVFLAYGLASFIFGAFLFFAAAIIQDRFLTEELFNWEQLSSSSSWPFTTTSSSTVSPLGAKMDFFLHAEITALIDEIKEAEKGCKEAFPSEVCHGCEFNKRVAKVIQALLDERDFLQTRWDHAVDIIFPETKND
jgi:hypothetical protein